LRSAVCFLLPATRKLTKGHRDTTQPYARFARRSKEIAELAAEQANAVFATTEHGQPAPKTLRAKELTLFLTKSLVRFAEKQAYARTAEAQKSALPATAHKKLTQIGIF